MAATAISTIPSGEHPSAVESLPGSGSCLLRCPQCQHLINLLASLQLAEQDRREIAATTVVAGSSPSQPASVLPPSTEPPQPRVLEKIASRSILRSSFARPALHLASRSENHITTTGTQHVRLATGHTVKVVSNGRRGIGRGAAGQLASRTTHSALPTVVVPASNPLANNNNNNDDDYGGSSDINFFTSLIGPGDDDVPLRQLSSASNVRPIEATQSVTVTDVVTDALVEIHHTASSSALRSSASNPLAHGREGRMSIHSISGPRSRKGSVLPELHGSQLAGLASAVGLSTTSDLTLGVDGSNRLRGDSSRPSGTKQRDASVFCLQEDARSVQNAGPTSPRKKSVFRNLASVASYKAPRGSRHATVVSILPAATGVEATDKQQDDDTAVLSASQMGPHTSGQAHRTTGSHKTGPVTATFKSVRAYLTNLPALDDASAVLQLLDVIFVLASVYLCCLALFLLHGPSRPWLINDATGAFVILAQLFTLGWTALQCFVRNRATPTSFVVNDTVGDAAKKYVASADFWLDVIVAFPVEWMVVPLLTARPSNPWSVANTQTGPWQTAAAVFSFFMLRHFLRYWRIASLVRSSNPIVSERSIFRFLTAVSIALAVLCACAVAFQAWEGPTLAQPSITLVNTSSLTSPSNSLLLLTLSDDGINGAAVTTPGLFASFDALYWSMATALTVGYGDITPKTSGGRAIAMLTMIAGTALLSTMTAIATSYFSNKDPVQQDLEDRMRKMTSMLEYFEVPWELQRDVIASFPAVMEAHSKAAFLEMINVLPEICRNRVEGYSRLRLLRQIPHFEGIEREHAFMLAKCLTQHFVAAQDTVVVQGELGNEMYFVVQGMLDVLVQLTDDGDEHVVVATIREGSFFGEHGLLEDTPRASTVLAITLSELLVLTRADFQDIVAAVPAIMDVFQRNVFEVSEDAARETSRSEEAARALSEDAAQL